MPTNVEEQNGSTTTLVPVEIEYESRDRGGDAVDEARIEQLRHAGLRPEDARRIERLERTLDLPAEKDKLGRVRAAAMLRADPDMRQDVVGQIIRQSVVGHITDYEALCRLQDLEVVGDGCDFARFVENTVARDWFVCYSDGEPTDVFEYRAPNFPDDTPSSRKLKASYADSLPE